jgi:hypothetical protein
MTHTEGDVERAGLEPFFKVLKHDFLGVEVESGFSDSISRAQYLGLRSISSKWTDREGVVGTRLIVGRGML